MTCMHNLEFIWENVFLSWYKFYHHNGNKKQEKNKHPPPASIYKYKIWLFKKKNIYIFCLTSQKWPENKWHTNSCSSKNRTWVRFPGNVWTEKTYNFNAIQVGLDTSVCQIHKFEWMKTQLIIHVLQFPKDWSCKTPLCGKLYKSLMYFYYVLVL